jgi:hypothetical protein
MTGFRLKMCGFVRQLSVPGRSSSGCVLKQLPFLTPPHPTTALPVFRKVGLGGVRVRLNRMYRVISGQNTVCNSVLPSGSLDYWRPARDFTLHQIGKRL